MRMFRTWATRDWWTTFILAKLNTSGLKFQTLPCLRRQSGLALPETATESVASGAGPVNVFFFFSHLLVKSGNQMGTSLPQLRHRERKKIATFVTSIEALFSNMQKLWMRWNQMQQVVLSTLIKLRKAAVYTEQMQKSDVDFRNDRWNGFISLLSETNGMRKN